MQNLFVRIKFDLRLKEKQEFVGGKFSKITCVAIKKNASQTISIYGKCMVSIVSIHLMYGIVWWTFSVNGGQPGILANLGQLTRDIFRANNA